MDDHRDYSNPQHRQDMILKMEEFERRGLFNEEIEDTHNYQPLDVNKIDLYKKKWRSNIKTYFSNQLARLFINSEIRKKVMDFDPRSDIVGGENLKDIKGGAIVTLNHVHPYDHYIPYLAFRRYFGYWKFRLFKLVKDSNYTYPGPVGIFMRNCNTLPISEKNARLNIESMKAVSYWLNKGKKLCIFAESSLWHHYKKPRPTKQGAFLLAAKNNVPVIPCFLTMKDTSKVGKDSLIVQKFTINIMPPIYPDPNLSIKQNTLSLQEYNSKVWKECYERVYGIKLEYLTQDERLIDDNGKSISNTVDIQTFITK
ncbi:MAG: 1-acyl-sn-glycerol-3-phosphate acyltransferase [Firmicutes bacterium]|nr:1-acyl-sn-glycerol-3-phosphate acyltransferase [Bacillota bacterium]MCL1954282.1 1-acyl-sn-glycerol-3-phosphate acyltransferase [Bacillota bacterium]